jgi:tetratricopeptide (TPR) repeat protein
MNRPQKELKLIDCDTGSPGNWLEAGGWFAILKEDFRTVLPGRQHSVTLCMIVKDEEKNLVRCLESVQRLADEIVIVDTGSTDSTLDLAQNFGAKVFQIEWPGNFSAARNASLEQANGEWILVLDADEVLEEHARAQLPNIIARTRADGLRLWQRNFLPADDLVRYRDQRVTRLFRNRPEIRYEGQIHEAVGDSIARMGGTVEDTDLVILHWGYSQPTAQGASRGERNLKLLIEMLASDPKDAYLHYQLGITYKQLKRPQEAEKHLKQALALDNSRLTPEILDELLMKLAQLRSASSQPRDCLRYALASLKYNPSNVISLYLAALAYLGMGQMREAYPLFVRIRQTLVENLKDVENLDAVIAYCQSHL